MGRGRIPPGGHSSGTMGPPAAPAGSPGALPQNPGCRVRQRPSDGAPFEKVSRSARDRPGCFGRNARAGSKESAAFSAPSQTRRGRSAYCEAGAEVRACFQQRRVSLDPRSHAPLPKHPSLARPRRRLVAQYGGAGNLRRIATLTPLLSKLSLFRRHFRDFRRPLNYAAPSATRMLLREIGFQEIQVRLHKAPTRFSTRSRFRDFVRNVILVSDLSQLPTTDLKEAYVESFLALYEKTFGRPYLLDYVRLTIWAKRGKKESKNPRIQEFRIEATQWDCLLDTHSWILEFLDSRFYRCSIGR